MEQLQGLFDRLNYQPEAPELFRQALTHRSYSRDHNERLEFLGDAILDLVIGDALFHQFPDKAEGDLSRYRAELVKGSHLAEMARMIELDRYICLGAGEKNNGGAKRDSILAGAFEAIFGAVYLDAGFDAAVTIAQSLFCQSLENIEKNAMQKDAKTALQEYLQAQKLPLPDYQVVSTSGKQHKQQFQVKCSIAGLLETVSAAGYSKKQAEQQAAEKMLQLIKEQVIKS